MRKHTNFSMDLLYSVKDLNVNGAPQFGAKLHSATYALFRSIPASNRRFALCGRTRDRNFHSLFTIIF